MSPTHPLPAGKKSHSNLRSLGKPWRRVAYLLLRRLEPPSLTDECRFLRKRLAYLLSHLPHLGVLFPEDLKIVMRAPSCFPPSPAAHMLFNGSPSPIPPSRQFYNVNIPLSAGTPTSPIYIYINSNSTPVTTTITDTVTTSRYYD